MNRVIKNAMVLYRGELVKKDVLFNEKEILEVNDSITGDYDVIDGSGLTLLPGLVDVHVHLREPGFEKKETIATGSMAAAHGGFTSIFAMPNLNPYPDNTETMRVYLDKIASDAKVHVYPFATITKGEKGKEVSDMHALSQMGIKWFSDDGVGVANDEVMKQAQIKCASENVLLSCHTENMEYRPQGACVHLGKMSERMGWKGISSLCESTQLERDLKLLEETHAKYHACHISAIESVNAIKEAKEKGYDVSGEVTAHHLLLEENDVKGTNWKMNPPLRSHEDRMCLIEALENGTLDFIANDHAPHTKEDKAKPMAQAAFGIVSLETSFPLLYTEFVERQKRWSLNQLVEWMSYLPAKRFGLEKTGRIEEGWHSDLVLVKLGEETQIDASKFYSKGRNTPFDGWSVKAEIVETIVDGTTVYHK